MLTRRQLLGLRAIRMLGPPIGDRHLRAIRGRVRQPKVEDRDRLLEMATGAHSCNAAVIAELDVFDGDIHPKDRAEAKVV